MKQIGLLIIMTVILFSSYSQDTFKPFVTEAEVPQNVMDLWSDYDPGIEPLDVEVIKTWDEENLVCKYVLFTVGTFKGEKARIAAFYTYPKGVEKAPAFVWSHGGGQRAERKRGYYFAGKGYATLDINWNGREMEEGITENTDWGKVDPSQGPRFYPKALRKDFYTDLIPDEFTIDSINSPRNSNWFLLTVAARRAITFLEQQPEVDPEKIGFTGYSMGGTITTKVAIDNRLKAVVPMVGGSGYWTDDIYGYPGSGRKHHPRELFDKTIDDKSYMPLVKCPVMFLSCSNDFNSNIDAVNTIMKTLPHSNWAVSETMHKNHDPGAKQWLALEYWFDHYLKGEKAIIPNHPESTLDKIGDKMARFSVTPDNMDNLLEVDVFFAYDSYFFTRYFKYAKAIRNKDTWIVDIDLREGLPLFVLAECTYKSRSGEPETTFKGGASDEFSIISGIHTVFPKKLDFSKLDAKKTFNPVFEDFNDGMKSWGVRAETGIVTYKFNDPDLWLPKDKKMAIQFELPKGNFTATISVRSRFKSDKSRNKGSFRFIKDMEGAGTKELVLGLNDFENSDKKSETKLDDWSNITEFSIFLRDTEDKININLIKQENARVHLIKWID